MIFEAIRDKIFDEPEVPNLDHGGVVVLGGHAKLGCHFRVPGNRLVLHPGPVGGVLADLNDGLVLAEVPDDAFR